MTGRVGRSLKPGRWRDRAPPAGPEGRPRAPVQGQQHSDKGDTMTGTTEAMAEADLSAAGLAVG